MGYSTSITPQDQGFIGIITDGTNTVYASPVLADSIAVQELLTTELHKLAAAAPRLTKKLAANTLRTTNSVNVMRAKTAAMSISNDVPIPLEDVGTYVPKPQITISKAKKRSCCGRS